MDKFLDYMANIIKGIMSKNPHHPSFIYDSSDKGAIPFTEFPFELMENLEEIQSLSIKYHKIRHISDKISEMQSLVFLDLSDLPLEELPPSFGKLSKLKSFRASDLSEPNFESYLGRLFEGPMHEADFTSEAGLKELPESFVELKSLEYLRLDGNRFEKFPPQILELRNLSYLDLSMNFIQEIPEEIGNLDQLTYLKLSRNNFHSIPNNIGKLKKLKRLRLDSLILESLPKGMGGMESLEMLEICQGELLSISPDIEELQHLQHLYLVDTKIDEIDLNALRVFLPQTQIHLKI